MATVVPHPINQINFGGLLSNVMAMKQREKEFTRAQKIEERKMKLAEEASTQAKTEFEAGEVHKNIVDRYNEALRDLMIAETKAKGNDTLAKARAELDAAQAGLTKTQTSLLQKRLDYFDKLINGGDEEKKELAANWLLEIDQGAAMKNELDRVRTQAAVLTAVSNALMDQAQRGKIKFDMQSEATATLLAGSDIIKRAFGEDIYMDTIATRLGEIGGIPYEPVPTGDRVGWFGRLLGEESPKPKKKTGAASTPEESIPIDLNIEGLLSEMRE